MNIQEQFAKLDKCLICGTNLISFQGDRECPVSSEYSTMISHFIVFVSGNVSFYSKDCNVGITFTNNAVSIYGDVSNHDKVIITLPFIPQINWFDYEEIKVKINTLKNFR